MAMQIPLVLVLWQDTQFGGSKRVFVADDINLSGSQPGNNVDFNDKASAVGVHPGPNFNAGDALTVSLFSDSNFGGRELVIGAGIYPNLKEADFNDCVSSVRFNGPGYKKPGLYDRGQLQLEVGPAGTAAQIAPIPVVVQLLIPHSNRQGGPGSPTVKTYRVATLVESSLDIGADYGSEFGGAAELVKIIDGPNPSALVRLYRETNPDTPAGHLQGGGHIDLVSRPGAVNLDDFAGIYSLADYGFTHQPRAVTIETRNAQDGMKH